MEIAGSDVMKGNTRVSERQISRSKMGKKGREWEAEEKGHFPDFSPLFQVYFLISLSLLLIEEECFLFPSPNCSPCSTHWIPNLPFPPHLISPQDKRERQRSGKKYLKIPLDDNSLHGLSYILARTWGHLFHFNRLPFGPSITAENEPSSRRQFLSLFFPSKAVIGTSFNYCHFLDWSLLFSQLSCPF